MRNKKPLRTQIGVGHLYFLCYFGVIGFLEVLYMSASFWLLRVESRDFSQADEEITACKAEQIHKMTTIFHSKWS